MKNRLLLNGLLLGIIVALGLVIWLQPEQTSQLKKISQLSRVDVTMINIQRSDKPDIHLEKKGKQWQMTAPYSAPVAASKIAILLTLLNEPIKSEYPAQGKDLTQFGLEPEQTSIQFNQESKITFGISHPVSYDRYLLRDNKILLIADTVSGAMKADVASFFSTQLIPKGAQISEINLPEGYHPKDDTAAKWQLISAIEVSDLDQQKQPSKGSIDIKLDSGKQLRYEIISTSPELWLGNAELNAKYQIADENAHDLLPSQISQ